MTTYIRYIRQIARKSGAVLICCALVFAAPGPSCYSVLAQEITTSTSAASPLSHAGLSVKIRLLALRREIRDILADGSATVSTAPLSERFKLLDERYSSAARDLKSLPREDQERLLALFRQVKGLMGRVNEERFHDSASHTAALNGGRMTRPLGLVRDALDNSSNYFDRTGEKQNGSSGDFPRVVGPVVQKSAALSRNSTPNVIVGEHADGPARPSFVSKVLESNTRVTGLSLNLDRVARASASARILEAWTLAKAITWTLAQQPRFKQHFGADTNYRYSHPLVSWILDAVQTVGRGRRLELFVDADGHFRLSWPGKQNHQAQEGFYGQSTQAGGGCQTALIVSVPHATGAGETAKSRFRRWKEYLSDGNFQQWGSWDEKSDGGWLGWLTGPKTVHHDFIEPHFLNGSQWAKGQARDRSAAEALFDGGQANGQEDNGVWDTLNHVARSWIGEGGRYLNSTRPSPAAPNSHEAATVPTGATRAQRDAQRTRDRLKELESLRDAKRRELNELLREQQPISPEETRVREGAVERFKDVSEQRYTESKLAEIHDLNNPRDEKSTEMQRLDEMGNHYAHDLPGDGRNSGRKDSSGVRTATLKSILDHVGRLTGIPSGAQNPDANLDKPTKDRLDKIEKSVRDWKTLNTQAQGDFAVTQAEAKRLALADQARFEADQDRNRMMMGVHGGLAMQSNLADSAFALKIIQGVQGAENGINEAIALNNQKLRALQQALQSDNRALAIARQSQQNLPQWTHEAQQTISQDNAQQKNLLTLNQEASNVGPDVTAFKTSMNAFLSMLDTQDGNASAGSALTAYQADEALITNQTIVGWLQNGNPNDPNFLSVGGPNGLQTQLDTVNSYLKQVQDGISQIQTLGATVPQGFGAFMIGEFPIPKLSSLGISNYSGVPASVLIAKLRNPSNSMDPNTRLGFWNTKLQNYQSQQTRLANTLDPNFSGTAPDPFGNPQPVSIVYWKNQLINTLIPQYQQTLRSLIGTSNGPPPMDQCVNQSALTFDQLVDAINSVTGAGLPKLEGYVASGDLTDLENTLRNYPALLQNMNFPNQTTCAVFNAKMDALALGAKIPPAARATILWAKGNAIVTDVNNALPILPPLLNALNQLVAIINGPNGIIQDINLDVQFLQATPTNASEQAVFNRKYQLLQAVEAPLQNIANTLPSVITYVGNEAPDYKKGGPYDQLYSADTQLYTGVQDAVNKHLPWLLASNGAPMGNAAAADAGIAQQQTQYQNYLTGYTDPVNGPQEGLVQTLQDVNDRLAPAGTVTRTEALYGEVQPYNLNDKIKKYGPNGEMAQRARDFNADAAVVNQILAQMDALLNSAKDPQNLGRFKLQTNLGTDAASIAYITKLTDANNQYGIQALGNLLQALGTKYKNLGGAPSVGSVSAASPPTTPPGQITPGPSLNPAQSIADDAGQAAARLVPSYVNQVLAHVKPSSLNNQPGTASAADAAIRILYDNGVVTAAQTGITEAQQAAPVVKQGIAILGAAIKDLDNDRAYVQNPGASAADAVIARKLNTYSSLATFTNSAANLYGQKTGWDTTTLNNMSQVKKYYDGVVQMDQSAVTLANAQISEAQTVNSSLQNLYGQLEAEKQKLLNWKPQIDNPLCTAMCQTANMLSSVEDATKQVLLTNIDRHQAEDRYKRAAENLKWEIGQAQAKRAELENLVNEVNSDALNSRPDLAKQLDEMMAQNSAWLLGAGAPDAAQAVVIPKSNLSSFVNQFFSAFQSQFAGQDVNALASQALSDPRTIANLLPHANMLDLGDSRDGFYVIYDTELSVPNGVGTSRYITAGNENLSATGYDVESPSNFNNAGWGDRGIDVQIKALRGQNWVNYLDVDFHRFSQDAGSDLGAQTTAGEGRMFVFDDYAAMLLNGKLYLAGSGYGDWAYSDRSERPTYYGGTGKTAVQFTPVVSLTAQEQAILIKDPRCFREMVNLDFSGFDPMVDKDILIQACADNHSFYRTQAGPSVNLGKLFDMDPQKQLTVDFYWAKQNGTDDYSQQSGGVSVLSGFAIHAKPGAQPWATVTNRTMTEMGTKFNTFGDNLTVKFAKGIVFTGEGRDVGGSLVYNGGISKPLSDHARLSLSYGNYAPGQNKRFVMGIENSFTMSQIWNEVVHHTQEDLSGGEPLKNFNKSVDDLFKQLASQEKGSSRSQLNSDAYDAITHDTTIKLLSEQVGASAHEAGDERNAGALFSNIRTRSMLGYASRPVSNELITRALGGGITSGADSSVTLRRKDKELTARDIIDIVHEGLMLKARYIELTENVLRSVGEIAEAERDIKRSEAQVQMWDSVPGRQEGLARLAAARGRLNQAVINYNGLTGRRADAKLPKAYEELESTDIATLTERLKKTLAAPDHLSEVLQALDRQEIQSRLGPESVDWMKFIPFVDRITFRVGLQLPDLLADEQFGFGAIVERSIYNPAGKARKDTHLRQKGAAEQEILQLYRQYDLTAREQAQRAEFLSAAEPELRSEVARSAQNLIYAAAGYRGGHLSEDDLRKAFEQWMWADGKALEATEQGAIAAAWSGLAKSLVGDAVYHKGGSVNSFEAAIREAQQNSPNRDEVGIRERNAEESALADARRLQKLAVDVSLGSDVTESGLGWTPNLAITAYSIMPTLIVQVKPKDLAELDKLKDQSESKMYGLLKNKVDANLAVQLFQNAAMFDGAQRQEELLDREILPSLENRVSRLKAGGGDGRELAKAQAELERQRNERGELELASRRAASTLNFLLGRSPEDSLAVNFDLDDALEGLRAKLTAAHPADTERNILKERLTQAQAEEAGTNAGLKVEEWMSNPVNVITRQMGQVIHTLVDTQPADPEKSAAAHIRTLQAQQDLDRFDAERDVQIARLTNELGKVTADLERPSSVSAEDRLAAIQLKHKQYALKSSLAALGVDPAKALTAATGNETVPSSFADLKDRVEAAYEKTTDSVGQSAPKTAEESEWKIPGADSHMRYMFYHEALDRTIINQGYVEEWVEFPLNNRDEPRENLARLAELETERQNLFHELSAAKARGGGAILMAQFASDVRLNRIMEKYPRDQKGPHSSLYETGKKVREQVQDRLSAEKDEIVALLKLPANTSLESLERLVAEEAGPHSKNGAADFSQIADRTITEVRGQNLSAIQHRLSFAGMSPDFTNSETLMSRLRADAIARQFSYRGFTLEGVWGIVHGKRVGGPFLALPDPRDIEDSLEHTLPKAIVDRMVATGEMQRRTTALQSLMQRVRDEVQQVQADGQLVPSAEAHFRAVAQQDDLRMAQAGDLLAARDTMVGAWTRLTEDVTNLQANFATLVMTLESVGLGDRGDKLHFHLGDDSVASTLRHFDPTEEILRYASRRMSDPDFASSFDGMLVRQGMRETSLRAQLSEKADLYHRMVKDSEAIGSMDAPLPEKRELLIKADPEGVRKDIQALLRQLPSNPAWQETLKLLTGELNSEIGKSEGDAAGEMRFSAKMRKAYWKAVLENLTVPGSVDGAFYRLENLYEAKQQNEQELVEEFVRSSLKPTDFVQRDRALDKYLKAEQAFDDETLKTFDSPELRRNHALASDLIDIFNLEAVLSRQKDWTRYGRGLGAIDALIMLQEKRVAALRFDGAPREEQEDAAFQLADLNSTRQHWTSEPWGLEPLYGLAELGADGKAKWPVQVWHTKKQIDEWIKQKKVDTDEKAGRRYLLGDDGKRQMEILEGVDAAEFDRDEAGKAFSKNKRQRGLFQSLSSHDFALTDMDGNVEKNLTFEELSSLRHDRGKTLFYFQSSQDKYGQHPAVAPMLAMNADAMPTVIVYDPKQESGRLPIPRERFTTQENLEAYVQQMRASGRAEDQAEAARFQRLEAGETGVAKMAEAAGMSGDQRLRTGWMQVKLKSCGFAMDAAAIADPAKGPSDVYLTCEEFQKEVHAMRTAPQKLARAQRALEDARAKLERASGTEGANKTYQAAKAAAKERLEAQVRKELKLPKRDDLPPDDPERVKEDQRVKLEVDLRLAKDPEYLAAQRIFNNAVRPFVKKGATLDVLQHRVDIAQNEVNEATEAEAKSHHVNLFATHALNLGVDHDRNIVDVSAQPVFGAAALHEQIGNVSGNVSHLEGTIYCAEMPEGRLVHPYTTKADCDHAASNWTLVDVHGQPVNGTADHPLPQGAHSSVSPYFRLMYYEDPETKAPILLNRSYLVEREKNAKKDIRHEKYWAFNGWNIAKLGASVPVGALRGTAAILTGDDPSRSGYLGEVRAHKGYASVENHRNFIRRAADHIDVLELDPTHPDVMLDSGQLPSQVTATTLKPGRNLADHSARADGSDVRFNLGAAERASREADEDLKNAKAQILTEFKGGVENVLIESRRSHSGWLRSSGTDGSHFTAGATYETSSVRDIPEGDQDELGRIVKGEREVIAPALRDSAVLNNDNGDEATGQQGGVSGHIETANAVNRVTARLGARQYEEMRDKIAKFAAAVTVGRTQAFSQADGLRVDKDKADNQFSLRSAAYQRVSALWQSAWDAVYPSVNRQSSQDSIRERIGADRREIAELDRAIAQQQSRGEGLRPSRLTTSARRKPHRTQSHRSSHHRKKLASTRPYRQS